MEKIFEDKEFHGKVTFFGVVLIDTVGSLIIPVANVTLPSISFIGDPDTGIYSKAANTISFTTSGTNRWDISSGGNLQGGGGANTPRMGGSTSRTNTIPNIKPAQGDDDTGLGGATDQLSLIAGGVESLRAITTGVLFLLGFQTTSQQLEPTNSTAAGNTVLPNTRNVEVIAPENDANDWILLPSLSAVPIGHQIIIACNGASAFEMRTPDASNEKINTVNSDGDTLEYKCTDTEVITVTKVSATDGWIATAQTALGAIATAVVPD